MEDQTTGCQECFPKRKPQARGPHGTTQVIRTGEEQGAPASEVALWAKAMFTRMALHTSPGTRRKGVFKITFDPSIFMNKTGSVINSAFVNDLGSVYSNKKEETELFRHLETCFQMTGGDRINWMVGINIVFSSEYIRLSQTAYLERVLKHFGMRECRPVSTPLKNQSLTRNPGKAIQTTKFQVVIGSLMYCQTGTCI